MLSEKLLGYLGFAAKARKLQGGYNTALFLLQKRKAKMILIASDAAEGTKDKISGKAKSQGVKCVIFGNSDELSHITGNRSGMVFTITDDNFAKTISGEIDRIRSEGENS